MYEVSVRLPERKKTERGFFKSFALLKKHYGLRLENFRKLPYPFNILMARQAADKALHRFRRDRELSIIKDDGGEVLLYMREQFTRHYDLNYIPVIPLYRLWQQPEHGRTAEILTLVCAFLYVHSGVSYYRDEGSYMYYNYELLQEWVVENDETEAREVLLQCLTEGEKAGEFVQEKMMDGALRDQWEALLDNYQPETAYGRKALSISRKAWDIAQAYPGANLFQHAGELTDDEDYGYCATISIQEYVSFVASTTDALSDDLYQMVENDFNERCELQQPEANTRFDEVQPAYQDRLQYAERIFDLIDELTTLLNQKP